MAGAAENVGRINDFWASRLEAAPADALEVADDALDALARIAAALGRADRAD